MAGCRRAAVARPELGPGGGSFGKLISYVLLPVFCVFYCVFFSWVCSSRLLVTFTENISALRKYIHHQILNDHVIKQFPVLDIPQTVPPCPPKATTSYRVGAGWQTSCCECYGLKRSHKQVILWLSIRVRRGTERYDNTDLVVVPVPCVESKARGRRCHCSEVLTREYGLWWWDLGWILMFWIHLSSAVPLRSFTRFPFVLIFLFISLSFLALDCCPFMIIMFFSLF